MKRLQLSEWAAVAEIIGTVAIVASLIFVGYEINRNTQVLQGNGENELYDALRPLFFAVMQDTETARVIKTGLESPDQLNDIDSFKYGYYLRNMLDIWERARSRFADGLINEEAWNSWDEFFVSWGRQAITDVYWMEVKQDYGEEFVLHVAARLELEQ